MINFEEAINSLDLKLFDKINSQSTDPDKQSFLACQLAVRDLRPGYNYLEIGSYLGGSLQPHLLDEKCAKIYSLDKRPERQPDSRGTDYIYLNNSTARMLELLSKVGPTDKITAIDGDTRSLSPSVVPDKMQLCFIDGEHTDEAVLSDFKFCLNVLDDSGAIFFHDSSVTYNGIASCVKFLQENGKEFRAYGLPNVVFVIELGDFPMHKSPAILERLVNNHESYIFSLQFNDYYRQFANKPLFRMYRSWIAKRQRSNVCE
jgi:Methyltransferase domain